MADETGYRSSFPPRLLEQWSAGLLSDSPPVQWSTFEQMEGLTDLQVLQVVERFLQFEQGDPYLKTKFLQQIKRICPWPIHLEVHKRGHRQIINVRDVPLMWADWPEENRAPFTQLEKVVFDDPTLVEMARELWLFLLEKQYPFVPRFTNSLKWTAALHYYTLKVIDVERAELLLPQELVCAYQISEDEIRKQCNCLEQYLLQL